MSIQTELTRISDGVSDALVALEEKGVTVPDGIKADGLADLIAAIEAGGGAKVTSGTFTPNSDITTIQIQHDLGVIPDLLFWIWTGGKTSTLPNATPLRVCGFFNNGEQMHYIKNAYGQLNINSRSKAISEADSGSDSVMAHSANSISVNIGGSAPTYAVFKSGYRFTWVAIGGLS